MREPGVAMFGRLGRALNHMDARAATSAGVSLALLGIIALGAFWGAEVLGLDGAAGRALLARVAASPLAPLGVVLVYCALALTGFPQAILIAATVAVFGASLGAAYAWGATMASAGATFAMGRAFGAPFARRLSAGRAASMMAVMRRHGVLASCAVRVVPSAPFVVVNAACGAAGMPWWKYLLGTGVGIVPKIAFLSAFTGQVDEALAFARGDEASRLWWTVALVSAWLAFLVAVRALYRRLRRGALSGLDASD